MADLNALFGVIPPTKRKAWGIPPKGKGPHKAEQYELPVPPADHPAAKALARATLKRARFSLARCKKSDVIEQVRKANTILFGVPNPTAAQKRAGQATRQKNKKTFPHNEGREAYVDVPNPPGSTEAISAAILDAARTSSLFGGPCINYGDPDFTDDSVRDWDISILWLFPALGEVVISNARTAEIWRCTYGIDANGIASFGTPQPAEVEVTAKGQEALKRARESGVKSPTFVRIHESGRIAKSVFTREAAAASGDDTAGQSTQVQLISAGPGNPHDKNYYTPEFITQTIETGKFAGVQCYYDHPTKFEDENQPERSVRKLAGWFSDPTQGVHVSDALGEQPAALATFHAVVGDSMAANLLATAREYFQSYPDGEFIGFSIYSYGVSDGTRTIDGEEWTNVVAMTECFSVDLVTHAGARGKPIFSNSNDSQENNNMANRPRGAKPATTGREAAQPTNPWLDADVQIDIRTDSEKKADAQKAMVEQMRAMIKKPNVRAFAFKEAGIAKEAMADDGTPSDDETLSDSQISALCTALGLDPNGPVATFVTSTLSAGSGDSTDDGTSGADESTEGTEDEDQVTEGELTSDAIDKLSDADAKKALKRFVKGGESDKTVTESKRNKQLAASVQTLQAQIESGARATLTESLVAKFQVPTAHQPLFKRVLASAHSPSDMTEAAKAYAAANLSGVGATILGVTRESRDTAAVPNFLKK